jgi:antitoxin component of RelBE/YafQ-DinJ toxin-antitoxin module
VSRAVSEFNAVLPPVRLPRSLLASAQAVAAARDVSLSQVVRSLLREYLGDAWLPVLDARQSEFSLSVSSNGREGFGV